MNENEGVIKLVSNQQAEIYMSGMQGLQMWTSRLRQQMVLENGTVWYLSPDCGDWEIEQSTTY